MCWNAIELGWPCGDRRFVHLLALSYTECSADRRNVSEASFEQIDRQQNDFSFCGARFDGFVRVPGGEQSCGRASRRAAKAFAVAGGDADRAGSLGENSGRAEP